MGAKIGTDYSITISTRYDPEVHKSRIQKWLDEYAPEYVVWVRELGADEVHPHYHIACVLKKETRTDQVKDSITRVLQRDRELDADERKHAVVARIHHDIVGLAGSYCRKEVSHQVVLKRGWTDEQLDAAEIRVEEYKRDKVDKMVPFEIRVLKEAFAEVWAEKLCVDPEAEARWSALEPPERYSRLFKIAAVDHPKLLNIRPSQVKLIIEHWFIWIEPTFDKAEYISNL